MKRMQKSAHALSKEITFLNLFYGITSPVTAMINYTYSVDNNGAQCKKISGFLMGHYLVFKFLIYRALLAKSKTYDVMRENQLLHRRVYILVHLFCFLFLVGNLINLVLGEFSIEDIDGERLCVFQSKSDWFIAAVLLCIGDTFISLACLYLTLLPITSGWTNKGRNKTKELGFYRTSFWASISIFSTFVLLVLLAYIIYTVGFIPGIVIASVGSFDMIVNLLSINLCWPLVYYWKVFCFVFGIQQKSVALARDAKSNSSRRRCVSSIQVSINANGRRSTYARGQPSSRAVQKIQTPRGQTNTLSHEPGSLTRQQSVLYSTNNTTAAFRSDLRGGNLESSPDETEPTVLQTIAVEDMKDSCSAFDPKC
eukprot:CAMPEP_0114537414 /NCGR_PEP_ID=MMETSP0109-20121206/29567_1 /TAXON_ID=29199 /ORGANISM="Chlorarachnion reptans, Strain CCCM449" /LENGTH=367 /DNA_ID=CAMNT_0001721305 /DNA_START=157 /DNA_END=1261 /DNA_ORIENTATION=-